MNILRDIRAVMSGTRLQTAQAATRSMVPYGALIRGRGPGSGGTISGQSRVENRGKLCEIGELIPLAILQGTGKRPRGLF